jgi:hypothetical protein
VTTSVNNGTIDMTAAGLAAVNNNGTNLVEIIGTLTDVNDTLASLNYSPTLNYSGNVERLNN